VSFITFKYRMSFFMEIMGECLVFLTQQKISNQFTLVYCSDQLT